MTTRVHVAGPLTPFKHLVRLIDENRISAVPIVDQAGTPVGVVSESDLLLKERRTEFELDTSRIHGWEHRHDRAKADGVIASELMTAPPVTVRTDTPIADAARLMQERKIRRLVVVDQNGRIAGVVSRSDLLQVFLRTDEDLRKEIVEGIIPTFVPADVESVEVDVRSNVVTLSGEVDRRSDAEILGRLSRQVEGVVDVINNLSYRWDDGANGRGYNRDQSLAAASQV